MTYFVLASKLKMLENMRVLMILILIVIGALGTFPNGLRRGLHELEIGVKILTIKATPLLRSTTIPRSVQETSEDLQSLKTEVKDH